jgi:hypothetical protein
MGPPPHGNDTRCRSPASLAEAQQRPLYTALNSRAVDAGNPPFGPIAAVFSNGYARNMTFIGVADSGMWESVCNRSFTGGDAFVNPVWPGPLDCTQPTEPGTFGALNHVLLAAERLWRPANRSSSPLVTTLARLYQRPAPPLDSADAFMYLEVGSSCYGN